jgi:hypothetical protein
MTYLLPLPTDEIELVVRHSAQSELTSISLQEKSGKTLGIVNIYGVLKNIKTTFHIYTYTFSSETLITLQSVADILTTVCMKPLNPVGISDTLIFNLPEVKVSVL